MKPQVTPKIRYPVTAFQSPRSGTTVRLQALMDATQKTDDLISTIEAQQGQLSADERRAILDRRIQEQVLRGYRIESRSDFQAVVVKGHRPNHVLHLILSVLTAGLWLFVWLGVVAFGGEKRLLVTVDEFGR